MNLKEKIIHRFKLKMSFVKYFLIFFSGFTIFLCLNNYYAVYSHIPNTNNTVIQEIIDQQDNIKVQFAYEPEMLTINTLTNLKFSVLNSTTDEHIKNFISRIVVTDGVEVFEFDNIKVKDGDFSVKHTFTNYAPHQVMLRADTNSSIIAASFEVITPNQSSSSPFPMDLNKSNLDNNGKSIQNFSTYIIIIAGGAVSVIMTIILLSILRKKS